MRIGILGGTFDPIHMVHLMIAEQVKVQCNLDCIWFLPAHIPPHKEGRRVADAHHRLQMVNMAIEGIPYFKSIAIELDRSGPSYTIDTIRTLQENYPEQEFFFIIGGDMIEYLPQWHQIEDLVQMIQFIGVHRPGYEIQNDLSKKWVRVVPFPLMDLSSSFIREHVQQGLSIRFMVPDQVRQYIEEKRLYGSGKDD